MQVCRTIDEIQYQKNSCLTLGTFDGIHSGHQKIIDFLIRRSQKENARSVLVTFDPHPVSVIGPKNVNVTLLTTLDEKIQLLNHYNIDLICICSFNKQLAKMEPELFIENFLIKKIGMRTFLLGFNHAFGKNRKGNIPLIRSMGKKFGFHVEVIPPQKQRGTIVSSTRIRKYLNEGKIIEANALLGRHYSVSGVVKRGKQIGNKLGFPTANLEVSDSQKMIPADGVYAVLINIGCKHYHGMAAIGYSPTFGGKKRQIEIHIHHFSEDIYHQKITIEFVQRIRDELHFDSVDDLVQQIKKDRTSTETLLADYLRRK